MKILVVGARGMLGQDLVPTLQAGHQVVTSDMTPEGVDLALDITDLAAVRARFAELRPAAVVNCAAYTNVDAAEADETAAYRVNALGPWNLALACREVGAALVQISTDYVFDGLKGTAYDEYDRPNPQGVYGRSKYAGELHVQQVLERYYIVRTSWLYGQAGKNFVETIIAAGRQRPELRVVNDQWGCPTSTVELAATVARLLETGRYGVYHATGQGVTTWFDFARAILQGAGLATPVLPQSTEELNRPAPRPRYSELRNRGLELSGLPLLPRWEESLQRYLEARAVAV